MKTILFALLISPCILFSQSKNAKLYLSLINPISLKQHLTTLAGPDMEGRQTATPGQQKTAAYIETQFKVLGLKTATGKGFQQSFGVYRDSVIDAAITVNRISYQLDNEFGVFTDMNHSLYHRSL